MSTPIHTLKQKKVLPYVVCVEGNIGSGKSTLLSNLKKRGFTVIEEPVKSIWGQYLPRLYQDLKRWGFCFQMEAMDWFRQLQSTKFEHLLLKTSAKKINGSDRESKEEECQDYDSDINQENRGDTANISPHISPKKVLLHSNSNSELHSKVIIVERSALSAITIFAKNLLDTDNMTKWEYSLLERFYSMIAWEPKHILYLRAEPSICCQRIQERNRDGEGKVNPILINNLHNKHELMFNSSNINHYTKSQNIIIVNGCVNEQRVLTEALQKISRLEGKI